MCNVRCVHPYCSCVSYYDSIYFSRFVEDQVGSFLFISNFHLNMLLALKKLYIKIFVEKKVVFMVTRGQSVMQINVKFGRSIRSTRELMQVVPKRMWSESTFLIRNLRNVELGTPQKNIHQLLSSTPGLFEWVTTVVGFHKLTPPVHRAHFQQRITAVLYVGSKIFSSFEYENTESVKFSNLRIFDSQKKLFYREWPKIFDGVYLAAAHLQQRRWVRHEFAAVMITNRKYVINNRSAKLLSDRRPVRFKRETVFKF